MDIKHKHRRTFEIYICMIVFLVFSQSTALAKRDDIIIKPSTQLAAMQEESNEVSASTLELQYDIDRALAAANTLNDADESVKWKDLKQTWEDLQKIAEAHPDTPEIQYYYEEGTFIVLYLTWLQKNWVAFDELLVVMLQISKNNADNAIILSLVFGMAEVLIFSGEDEDWPLLERAWLVLRQVAEAFPDDSDIQLEFAACAVILMDDTGKHEKWELFDEAWIILQQVAKAYPDSSEIQLEFAKGEEIMKSYRATE